ncbi:DeoR/GlpR family DNA-binding transcription regulator [Pectinatus cerevisiiphilus]|uniref:Lactose phosphotransferase system repressor n=1 Tax=Pectinatus cerevisiiphilus TaxID=86956 RepID=A0A4R3K6D7_9FIRM|nr:DeoR/GlpR family DNA-binding transcription regulator [Pectinatus cerevisiiphilus]TCS78436.1 DeoR family transcriptional regulator [Pectinatus cerevisiiphilus]
MNDRHAQILDVVNEYKKVEVNRLAEMLDVSQVTIRKDLDILAERGLLDREHGYALCRKADDVNNKLAVRYESKMKIAVAAAEMVSDGETIMVESGSSCTLLAEQVAKTKKDITIITNSAFIASYIRDKGNVRIILLGGEYQRETQAMVGPLLKKFANEFFVDKLFIGTDGFIPKVGFTSGEMMRMEAVHNMAESARQVIILTDSSKFQKQGVVLQFRFSEVSKIVTDSGVSDEVKKLLEKNHIDVTVAY